MSLGFLDRSPEFEAKLEWMRGFMRTRSIRWRSWTPTRPAFMRAIRPLQQEVKRQKLWATHLPPELGGQGYGQVKLGLMHEIEGASMWGPIVFGNQAPDSGNSEVLAHFGTPEQKERWLYPLLDGKMRSAFSMTEPEHRRLRPHAAVHDRRARRRRVGDQRAQVVHVATG